MIKSNARQVLVKALIRLLRPLVRILLRNNVPYAAFTDIVKQVYVDVATHEFTVEGKPQTISRVATITGLSRKEVSRVQNIDSENDDEVISRYNRAARVVFGWVHDKKYANPAGESAVLPFDGDENSFSDLVKAYSGDVPPRAICDELLQIGVVSCDDEGDLTLLSRAYIPTTGEEEKLGYLGADVGGLIATIDHNIQPNTSVPYFQRKVYYDNLPEECLESLQALLANRGQKLLEFFDKWMAKRDRDVNPKAKGSGRKAAGIGLYYFAEDHTKSEDSPIKSSVDGDLIFPPLITVDGEINSAGSIVGDVID